MRRVLVAVMAAAMLAPAGAVSAGQEPHDMTGRWPGFFQGGSGDPHRGGIELQILSQDDRRFMGTFTMMEPGLPPNPCTVEGTVSNSLNVSAKGDCGGSKLDLHGRATEELQDGFIVPCILEGRWTLKGPDGKAEGTIGLLHMMGGPTELASGHWEGSAYHSEAEPPDPVRADLGGSSTGGDPTGEFMVGDASFDVFYELSVHEGSDTHGFAMIGGGDLGILVIAGRFQEPPEPGAPARIDGTLVVHLADGGLADPRTFEMERVPSAAS